MISRIVLLTLLTAPWVQAEDTQTAALFVRRVWPLFQEKCLACHGQDEAKIKGGLDMRTLAGTLKGGDSETTALVPGKPEQSPLYLASTRTHGDWEAMPPKENDKLTTEQLTWLKDWISAGAPWPEEAERQKIAHASADAWSSEDGITVKTRGALSPDWATRRYKPESLWAYQPVKKPALPANGQAHPIDALIAAKMPQGMQPAPAAEARDFIRRASFDLIGLPPTPEEVENFVKATQEAPESDQPYTQLIDRLLDSPHYGERMARHWLDVVRYADSSGFANDYERGNAWRYRDYVVRSFNDDKPYDQFIQEQIAGDEMAARTERSADIRFAAPQPVRNLEVATKADPRITLTTTRKTNTTADKSVRAPLHDLTSNAELLIATGFLRMGPWELTSMEVAKVARQRFLDDVTNSVGETFLAHSLQCARCHDHKFDPVPTHDYYAIQACFSTTQLAEQPAPFLKSENTSGFEEKKHLLTVHESHLQTLRQLDDKMLQNAEAWFANQKLDRTVWDQAVTTARAFVQGGGSKGKGKNGKTRNFTGVFEMARSAMQKQGLAEDMYPPKLVGFTPVDFGNERVARKGLERLKWELERYEPYAFSVYNGRTPPLVSVNQPMRMPENRMTQGELEQTSILGGGDPFTPTKPVQPGVLTALFETAKLPETPIPEAIEGRRTALAKWIASPQNPLTTRTLVNRLWLWHFGQAIAGNPNNFGSTGKKPTHPELLDWLAATFVEKGWSFKAMHRLIMTSQVYRRSSKASERSADTPVRNLDVSTRIDSVHPRDSSLPTSSKSSHPADKLRSRKANVRAPLNTATAANPTFSREDLETHYAVFKPRRLTAEELRDAMLSVTGELNPLLGGIPNRPEINLEVAMQPRQVMGTFASAWVPNPLPAQRHRRSLYALKIRGLRDPFMEVFNEPGPDFSCEAREVSTVTPQVFSLFNGQASYDRALALAHRVLQEQPQNAITRVFQFAYGRLPSPDEKAACEAHWQQMEQKQRTLVFTQIQPALEVTREAVEENTGEKFSFQEKLPAYADFIPDLQPADTDARTRALADVCLVLMNSNEFAYVY